MVLRLLAIAQGMKTNRARARFARKLIRVGCFILTKICRQQVSSCQSCVSHNAPEPRPRLDPPPTASPLVPPELN